MILEDQEINDAAEAFQNLAGDGDLDQQSGLIEVDRSEPLHPVIRFRLDRFKLPEGGGSGIPVPGAGCYTIVDVEETVGGETVTRKYLANQYYLDGNVAKSTNFTDPLDPATQYGKFIALRVPMGTSGSPSIQTYATYAAMNTASLNAAYVTLPLYHLDANGDVICDFRNIPRVQAVERLS